MSIEETHNALLPMKRCNRKEEEESDLGLHKRANDRVRPRKANYHRLPSGSGEATSSTYAGVQ